MCEDVSESLNDALSKVSTERDTCIEEGKLM